MAKNNSIKKQIHPYFTHIKIENGDGTYYYQTGLIIARGKSSQQKALLEDLLVMTYSTADKKSTKMSMAFHHINHNYSPTYEKHRSAEGVVTLSIDNTIKKEYIGLSHSQPEDFDPVTPEKNDYIVWLEHRRSLCIKKIKLVGNGEVMLRFIYPNLNTKDKKSLSMVVSDPKKNSSLKTQLISAAIFKKTGRFVGLVKEAYPEDPGDGVVVEYEPFQNVKEYIDFSQNK